ncbi:hypothetical protein IVU49_12325 [Salmonella enterica subsp. enterica serovar Worthington]|nr:hypothetical protein [Salmonella enterica subsp. enterica serovar Worthington]MBP1522977.1 hypothetical protein [Salmonella enterica subsp. enterica serovar Worthington]
MNTSDTIALWTAIGTCLAVIATVITAVITGCALRVAIKTLHSWKDKEKFIQQVRLKRAILEYRQKIESIKNLNNDHLKINEHVINVLQPALSNVYHEMKLAGFKENECIEFELFNIVWSSQQNYESSHMNYKELLDSAVELQKAIKINF